MSFSVPILSRQQIEQVRSLVHGILEENRRAIDDVLSEVVQVESTNILGLYNLAVEQWQKKQKTVDNLCHFALTMMATVQLLWDQKYHHEEQLANDKAALQLLQCQNDELRALNEQYKRETLELNNPHSPTPQLAEKNETLSKCQSCIHFREQLTTHGTNNKCGSLAGDNCAERPKTESNGREGESERASEVQSLQQEKRKLERELSQAVEESQLTRMQLQLAELAIKDALAYKASYLSLVQNSASRISEKSRSLQNADYLNGEIECQSHIDDSFTNDAKRLFNGCPDDAENADNADLPAVNGAGGRREKGVARSTVNPFKKKVFSSGRNQQEQEEVSEHSKTLQAGDCSNDEFEAYRPESHVDERRVSEMINRFKIKKSRISDRQETAQESLDSENSLFKPRTTCSSMQTPSLSAHPQGETSLNKFYDFLTKKVVRNRIKHH